MRQRNRNPLTKSMPREIIENKIILLRNRKVILDSDLSKLYQVNTKQLKRAVNRNIERFPDDFMLRLTKEEYRDLRRHFGTLKRGEHTKYPPYAFTEQGVAMLSSVLHSKRAILVNIQIMRVFTRLREMLLTHVDLKRKIDAMEKKYDRQFSIIFDTIRKLLEPPQKLKKQIGFHAHDDQRA